MRADDDEDDDQELRTFVMVHDIKPPFLDGRLVLSKQSQPVVPVRHSKHSHSSRSPSCRCAIVSIAIAVAARRTGAP